MLDRGEATMYGKAHPPCSIRAMSPLAKAINLPGVAIATSDLGILSNF